MKGVSISSEEVNRDPFVIFDLIWSRLSTTVKLPDTLVFRNAELHAWLFTTSAGQVRRKHKKNCTLEAILDAFCKQRSPSEIVAYLLVQEYEVTIRYLTREALREYFLSRNKPLSTCVVQKYVPPLGEDRSVLKTDYLSGHCIPERYGVLDTFDSSRRSRRCHLLLSAFIKKPSFDVKIKLKELLVEENVANRVASICTHIVKQVEACSNGDCHVRSFEAVFILGSHNNPTLLWCSNFDSYSRQQQLEDKLRQVEKSQRAAKMVLERPLVTESITSDVTDESEQEVSIESFELKHKGLETILQSYISQPSNFGQPFSMDSSKLQPSPGVVSTTKPIPRSRSKALTEYAIGSPVFTAELHKAAWKIACGSNR